MKILAVQENAFVLPSKQALAIETVLSQAFIQV
jgi:hypothetical protein